MGLTSLAGALEADDPTAVEAVLNDDPMAVCTPLPRTGEMPILESILCGRSAGTLAALLHCGADVNCVGKNGLTALETIVSVQEVSRPWQVDKAWRHLICEDMVPRHDVVSMPGSPAVFDKQAMDENICLKYAHLLLMNGAKTKRAGLACAEMADAHAMYAIADLIRNWGGKHVLALRGVNTSTAACLPSLPATLDLKVFGEGAVGLPRPVFAHVCDMLAPPAQKL